MDPENTNQESSTFEENQSEKQQTTNGANQTLQENPPEVITKIADIQRMNIDQLNLFGKNIGLKHLGLLNQISNGF